MPKTNCNESENSNSCLDIDVVRQSLPHLAQHLIIDYQQAASAKGEALLTQLGRDAI